MILICIWPYVWHVMDDELWYPICYVSQKWYSWDCDVWHNRHLDLKIWELTDDIFLRQEVILRHNLPVEDLGTTFPPKEDPVFDLKPLPDDLKYAYIDDKKIYPVIISSQLSGEEE